MVYALTVVSDPRHKDGSIPLHTAIRLRLEAAHAAVEVALIEARRRVRLNEGRERQGP